MSARIGAIASDAGDEMSARMNGGKRTDLHSVEDAEDVEFAFLGEISRVGEEGEGDTHSPKLTAASR